MNAVFDENKESTSLLLSEDKKQQLENLRERINKDLSSAIKRNTNLVHSLSEISNLGDVGKSYHKHKNTLNHTKDKYVKEQIIRELNKPWFKAYGIICEHHDYLSEKIDKLNKVNSYLNAKPEEVTLILKGYAVSEKTAQDRRDEQYVNAYLGELESGSLWTTHPEIAELHKECGGENPADENDAAIKWALCTLMDYDLNERLAQFCG